MTEDRSRCSKTRGKTPPSERYAEPHGVPSGRKAAVAGLNVKEMAEAIVNGSHEELVELTTQLIAGLAELRQWAEKAQADDQESPESSGHTEEEMDEFSLFSVARQFMAKGQTRNASGSSRSRRRRRQSQH